MIIRVPYLPEFYCNCFSFPLQHVANAHRDWVTALSFVPGVDVVMSGDRRGLLKLWDVQNCRALGKLDLLL